MTPTDEQMNFLARIKLTCPPYHQSKLEDRVGVQEAEGHLEHMEKMGWIRRKGNFVELTECGFELVSDITILRE